jgi:3-dehydroquinate synthetase
MSEVGAKALELRAVLEEILPPIREKYKNFDAWEAKMAFQCAVASRGWTAPGLARRLSALASSLGLPTQCPNNLDHEALCAAVGFDKKRSRATLTLVVPCAPGRVELRPLPVGEVAELVQFLF